MNKEKLLQVFSRIFSWKNLLSLVLMYISAIGLNFAVTNGYLTILVFLLPLFIAYYINVRKNDGLLFFIMLAFFVYLSGVFYFKWTEVWKENTNLFALALAVWAFFFYGSFAADFFIFKKWKIPGGF